MQEIRRFLSRANFENEVELRIKSHEYKTGISEDVFTNILNHLKNQFGNKKANEDTVYIDGKYRFIYDGSVMNVQEKINQDRFDIPDHNIRMSESKEKPVANTEFIPHPNIVERRRKRVSYTVGELKIDLTTVNETTYECEVEIFSKTANLEILKDLFTIVYGPYVKKSSYEKLKQSYATLIGEQFVKFIGPLPFTLRKSDFDSGKLNCGYSVTEKTDGTRKLLYVDSQNNAFMINRPKQAIEFNYCGKHNKSNSLIDGEYIKGTFLAFDLLFINKVDVRSLSHIDRLKHLNTMIDNGSTKVSNLFVDLKIKTFYGHFGGCLYKIENGLLAKSCKNQTLFNTAVHLANKKHKFEIDGIIFTPLFKSYQENDIFKWKLHNTIDFFIVKQRANNTHETWQLQIASLYKGKYDHWPFSGPENNSLFFVRKGNRTISQKLLCPVRLGYTQVPLNIAKNYQNRTVVEFNFENNIFVPLQSRNDKSFANNVLSVNDAWESITTPITKEIMKAGIQYTCLRKYHNSIKRHLINKYCESSAVLDIGSGAGGDITKYSEAKVRYLIGVDIVNVQYDHPVNMKFYKTSGLYKIKEIIEQNKPTFSMKQYFDTVCSFFAMHYFFENDITLANFFENLMENTKKNSVLVFTYLDGTKVNKLLKNKSEYSNSAFKIKKHYDVVENITGNKITVDLHNTKYFNKKESIEYLVLPNELQSLLKKIGFSHIETKSFQDIKEQFKYDWLILNKDERIFSSLNNFSIFKKV